MTGTPSGRSIRLCFSGFHGRPLAGVVVGGFGGGLAAGLVAGGGGFVRRNSRIGVHDIVDARDNNQCDAYDPSEAVPSQAGGGNGRPSCSRAEAVETMGSWSLRSAC